MNDEIVSYNEWLEKFVLDELQQLRCGSFSWTLSAECREGLCEILISYLYEIAYIALKEDLEGRYICENIFKKVFSSEFFEEEREEALKEQTKFLKEKGTDAFFNSAPLLKEKLKGYGKEFVCSVVTMLNCLKDNECRISEIFFNGKQLGPIVQIKRFSHLTYPGAERTTLICFENGEVVYKPRDCRLDKWFKDISKKYSFDCVYVPEVLAIDDQSGIFEYVEKTSLNSEEESLLSISNLGAYVAIVTVFGCVDIHKGNFYLSGNLVVPVDLEGLMHPKKMIEIEKKIGSRNTIINNPSIQRNPGQFLEGFKKMYVRCIELRQQLINELDITKDYSIRVFLDGTKTYQYLMDMINQQSRLKEEKFQDYYLDWKRRNSTENDYKNNKNIYMYTNECLKQSHIPFLTTKADSVAVYAKGRLLQDNYFEETAIERAKSKLNSISEYKLNMELDTILDLINSGDGLR